jgi:hypothetical protein
MTIGAAAAVERHRKRNQGEEQMTAYRRDEKDQGWKFKILRSASGASKRPDQLARVPAEESSAGWELLEKFDDGRLRLKRSASARDRDADLPSSYDPYRTQYGISEGALTAYWVFGILAVIVPVIVLLIWLTDGF